MAARTAGTHHVGWQFSSGGPRGSSDRQADQCHAHPARQVDASDSWGECRSQQTGDTKSQLLHLRDLCRQLVLLLGILHRRLSPEEKDQLRAVLRDLSEGRQTFEEAG